MVLIWNPHLLICAAVRYKQSIVAISAREKELEGTLQQHRQLISNYEEEAG
jgi:hypothetical protein